MLKDDWKIIFETQCYFSKHLDNTLAIYSECSFRRIRKYLCAIVHTLYAYIWFRIHNTHVYVRIFYKAILSISMLYIEFVFLDFFEWFDSMENGEIPKQTNIVNILLDWPKQNIAAITCSARSAVIGSGNIVANKKKTSYNPSSLSLRKFQYKIVGLF